ncbi:hypothetical protein HZH68_003866 [Vespula germanica]|uniref:Uncharacterized protein n=1 Tax=Vespula germanica TaxID=30212 RepID=A0A834NGP9_VESGE|nr:hypothetical protein HZH68_003866 [Vespula germanica]
MPLGGIRFEFGASPHTFCPSVSFRQNKMFPLLVTASCIVLAATTAPTPTPTPTAVIAIANSSNSSSIVTTIRVAYELPTVADVT